MNFARRLAACSPYVVSSLISVSVGAQDVPAPPSGTSSQLASPLKPDDDVVTLDELSVQAEQLKNSAAGLSTLRKAETGSIDAISSADFGKFSGSDLGDLLIKIPGVTVGTGSFAVIRGLNERYSPTMLDGIVMPSPDAEKQTPPTDIFPSKLLDAIVVHKSYQPYLPSFSGGGALDMRTAPIPEQRSASVSVGMRFQADTLGGGTYLNYDSGGNRDAFALGNNDRVPAPSLAPSQNYNRAVDVVGLPDKLPPGYKFNLSYADVIELKEHQKLGFNIITSYDSDYDSSTGSVQRRRVAPFADLGAGRLDVVTGSREYERSEENILIGGFGNVGYQFNENNLVAAKLFVSKSAIDEVQHNFNFADPNQAGPIDAFPVFDGYRHHIYDINYRERLLAEYDVSGEHFLGPKSDERKVFWRAGQVTAQESQPDQRTFALVEDVDGDRYAPGTFFIPDGVDYRGGLARTWRETEETTNFLSLGAELPVHRGMLDGWKFKPGVQVDDTERTYTEVQADGWQGGEVPLTGLSSANQVVNGQLFNPVGSNATAERKVSAVYTAIEIPIHSKVKFTPGARVENLEIVSNGRGRLGNVSSQQFYQDNISLFPGVNPLNPSTNINLSSQIYPSYSLSYEPVKSLVFKLGYSETLARPSLRELGSYFTKSVEDDSYFHGNAGLRTSPVRSWDFRVEKFFSGADLLAFSVFNKEIENPIERSRVVLSNYSGLVETVFNNPDTAKLTGAEVEGRKNLGFLGDLGELVTLGGNFTYIDAEVGLLPGERNALAPFYANGVPAKRRLYDQPEWLANADLTVSVPKLKSTFVVTYTATSPVLISAPADAAYARFRDGYEQVDASVTTSFGIWDLKLQVSNLFEASKDQVYDPGQSSGRILYASEETSRSYSVTVSRDF